VKLAAALDLRAGEVVALVGAGGKTTALGCLASDLLAFGPVVSSTTTHLALSETRLAPHHLILGDASRLAELGELLRVHRHVLVTGPPLPHEGKLAGLTADQFSRLAEVVKGAGITILVEADGARGLPVKVPERHEPAVPREATHIVVMAGLDALGRTLDAATVHRAERFAEFAESSPGETITSGNFARALTHPQSYPKVCRPATRFSIVLNKADTDQARETARHIAAALLKSPLVERVVIAALAGDEPVSESRVRMAGIVLAAGEASRMGRNKLLLPFRGRPILQHVVDSAREQTHEVIVVLGAGEEAIRQGVDLARVRMVSNLDWREGQSSSLRAGLAAVGSTCGAAVFFLGDQPGLPGELVGALMDRHARTLASVVAPRHAGQRANPVLFDRSTWSELSQVTGDQGGRALFDRYPVEWVEWEHPADFADVDTDEDYRHLMSRET